MKKAWYAFFYMHNPGSITNHPEEEVLSSCFEGALSVSAQLMHGNPAFSFYRRQRLSSLLQFTANFVKPVKD